ncbi:hypothetical protein [Nocardioides caldifontis]|uniref:hypothetical protein n=1 Tax=Nocardioides caldifontis TaxID=2588938 RepID=UPI0011E0160C|nr:hypothetical protein [Nocardioides caldifontis]
MVGSQRTAGMSVDVVRRIDAPTAERLYEMYLETFGDIAIRAANRHLFHKDEFLETMYDERVDKYLVRDDDSAEPLGLLTLTNDLETVHWVSPQFFAHQYPEFAERDAIYYLGFTMVAPGRRRTHAFSLLARQITEDLLAKDAMCAFDICAYNDEVVGLADVAQLMLGEFGKVRPVDTQTYYAAVPFQREKSGETRRVPEQRPTVEGTP